jgi:hypothetical protein
MAGGQHGKPGVPRQWRWCNGIYRCCRLQAVEWRRRWPIGDLHCADIGGKANIKRASLKRADPWGAPARKAPIAAHRT